MAAAFKLRPSLVLEVLEVGAARLDLLGEGLLVLLDLLRVADLHVVIQPA